MQNDLRDMVEQYGVFAVLDALSGICGKNAEVSASPDWTLAEAAIDAAASKVLDLFGNSPD